MTTFVFILGTLLSPTLSLGQATQTQSVYKVVLDPGHGGADKGAIYKDKSLTFTEKSATLELALEIQRQLKLKNTQTLQYEVTLTRTQDEDLALNQRTAIANEKKANVFISIHLNSFPAKYKKQKIEGVEVYILNSTSDVRNQRLAKLENSGLDPTKGSKVSEQQEVNLIVKDLKLDSNLKENKRLACSIEGPLTRMTGQKNRGVKEAQFVVLLGADMPSILIEAGFIHSAKDRSYHLKPHLRRAMASAIVKGIELFRTNSKCY